MIRLFLASTILVLWSGGARAGDEFQSPTLLPDSGHISRDPLYQMAGIELHGDVCVAWVVADEPDVHRQHRVNIIIQEVLVQVAKQRPSGCANVNIHFYSFAHNKPRDPSFRITDHLGSYDNASNRITFLGDDKHHGSWAEGPAKDAEGKPWASNAPRADDYSINLVSVNPTPGTPLKIGSEVSFEVKVSYKNKVSNKGLIVLVFQADETGMIKRDVGQMSQEVSGRSGEVTLTDSIYVPDKAAELFLYVPLMPEGMRESKGQVIVRYPIER